LLKAPPVADVCAIAQIDLDPPRDNEIRFARQAKSKTQPCCSRASGQTDDVVRRAGRSMSRPRVSDGGLALTGRITLTVLKQRRSSLASVRGYGGLLKGIREMAGRGMNWHRASWQTKMRRNGSEQIEKLEKHSRKRKRRRRNVRISRDGLAQHALKTHTERASVLIPRQTPAAQRVEEKQAGGKNALPRIILIAPIG
jgi:hypothetical protein